MLFVLWKDVAGQLPRGLSPVPTTRHPAASPVATEATKLDDLEPMSAPSSEVSEIRRVMTFFTERHLLEAKLQPEAR